MTAPKVQTLYHPAFPDETVEVEGAEQIKAYQAAGWLDKAPKTTTTNTDAQPATLTPRSGQ